MKTIIWLLAWAALASPAFANEATGTSCDVTLSFDSYKKTGTLDLSCDAPLTRVQAERAPSMFIKSIDIDYADPIVPTRMPWIEVGTIWSFSFSAKETA